MLKRIFDISASSVGLILLSPLILIVSIFIRVKLGTPIFFIQDRVGKDNKTFKIIKFRTMTNERDKYGELLPDDRRLNSYGMFLRKTSIDELPQLINVLKGEMSLVGPRPLLVEYLPLYNEEQKRRHNVRPGITGWSQINGRNAISWKQKFDLDIWYINNKSFLLDIKILILTVFKVIRLTNKNENETEIVDDFKGNN